jgi:flavodoxin
VKHAKEEIASSHKPALKTKFNNINSYDVVFVGSPIWYGTIAPPVATFLSEYDLSGKIVVPFVTHARGGPARSFDDIAKLCPQSAVLDGIAVGGKDVNGLQDELSKRLHEIEILK